MTSILFYAINLGLSCNYRLTIILYSDKFKRESLIVFYWLDERHSAEVKLHHRIVQSRTFSYYRKVSL